MIGLSSLAQTKAASSALRTAARRMKATLSAELPASVTKQPVFSDANKMQRLAKVGGAIGLAGLAQWQFGSADNFFEHKFTTNKDPQDLADYYGTEDFMEVFCVFPFMVDFMMRQAEFDDEGTIHAWGLMGPKAMKVSIDFDESEEEDTVTWFNKQETFKDVAPSFLGGFTFWEMVQNFGYRMREDGSCEVYHQGEKFRGFFPLRILFEIHSRYVIWATKRYINSDLFGSEDREDDVERFRHNIPLHEFKLFVDGLTRQVELAKNDAGDKQRQDELEVTIKRLQTISTLEHSEINPRLRGFQSHKTHVQSVHLIVDDQETKDTLRTAMEQIGSTEGQRQEPVAAMQELSRRTTIALMKNETIKK